MSEIAIENRSGLITRLPTFAFVIACVVAGLLGSFVVFCISGVVFVGLLSLKHPSSRHRLDLLNQVSSELGTGHPRVLSSTNCRPRNG
jgi:hypothetical protein